MTNPFITPPASSNVYTYLVYGDRRVGKTRFAFSFHDGKLPIALIDSDLGAKRYSPDLYRQVPVRTHLDAVNAVNYLHGGGYKDYSAVVVDTTTAIYQMIVQAQYGTRKAIPIAEWGQIKQAHKAWLRKLQELAHPSLTASPIPVIFVAEEKVIMKKVKVKDEKGNERDEEIVDAIKADADKKDGHRCDVELRLFIQPDDAGALRYGCEVMKDRSEVFKMGTVIENPTAAMWQQKRRAA